MRQIKLIFLTIFFSSLALKCVVAQDGNDTKLSDAIKSQNNKYMTAYNNADIDTLLELHTNDVTVIAANRPVVKGRKELRSVLHDTLRIGPPQIILSTTEVERHGNTAYEIGEYSLTITPDGQDVIEDSGNYVVIWKNHPTSGWLLHVDMYSSGEN